MSDVRGDSRAFDSTLLYRCETDPQWAYDRIQQLRHKLASAMLAAEAVAASMEHVLNELTEEVAS